MSRIDTGAKSSPEAKRINGRNAEPATGKSLRRASGKDLRKKSEIRKTLSHGLNTDETRKEGVIMSMVIGKSGETNDK